MHTYCVVLRPQPSLNSLYPHTKRYYLRANSAAQAMLIASEDPEWLAFGVEPAVCLLARHKVNVQCLQRIRSLLKVHPRPPQGAWRPEGNPSPRRSRRLWAWEPCLYAAAGGAAIEKC